MPAALLGLLLAAAASGAPDARPEQRDWHGSRLTLPDLSLYGNASLGTGYHGCKPHHVRRTFCTRPGLPAPSRPVPAAALRGVRFLPPPRAHAARAQVHISLHHEPDAMMVVWKTKGEG